MVAPISISNRRFSFTAGLQPPAAESKRAQAPALFVDTEGDASTPVMNTLQASPRETKGQPSTQARAPWATMDAQSFLLAHRELLARMAADPDWSHTPMPQQTEAPPTSTPPPAQPLSPADVFGFYDTLARRPPLTAKESTQDTAALRCAVISERHRIKALPQLKAAEALDANLRRVEKALCEREAAWIKALDTLTVRQHLQAIAAGDQPRHVKAAGLLAVATARPEALLDATSFDTCHQLLAATLAADPVWRASADESLRATAPEPGTVFRFYQGLRQAMATHPLWARSDSTRDEFRNTLMMHAYSIGLRGLDAGGAVREQLESLAKADVEAAKDAMARF